MSETIRQTAELSADDRAALLGDEPNPFGIGVFNLQWRPKDLHFLLDVDARPVSHVGVVRHIVRTESLPLRLAGVGYVITAAGARGRGHAPTLIRHVTRVARETWADDAALLFCLERLVPFYRRLGFQLLHTGVLIDQPGGSRLAPLPVMILPLRDRSWPAGPLTLGSLPW